MRFLMFAAVAIAICASAQEPTVSSPVRLESITAESAAGGVRIDIALSAPVDPPRWLTIEGDSFALELAGVIYQQGGKDIAVNRNGVTDVRVSMQQQTSASTRITINLSRLQPYKLTTHGNRISIEIGRQAQTAATRSKPVPAARGGAIDRIFRREPKPPVYNATHQTGEALATENSASAKPLPPLRFPDVAVAGQSPTTGSATALRSDQDARFQAPNARADLSRPQGINRSNGAVDELKNANSADLAESLQQIFPLARVAPAALMASVFPFNVSITSSPKAIVEQPLEFLSTNAAASSAPRAPEAAPASAAAPAGIPAMPNSDLRTAFHIKFVQQDVAYVDGGRNQGLAEGMKLAVLETEADEPQRKAAAPQDMIAELTVIGIAETSAVAQIRVIQRNVTAGDVALLSDSSLQTLVQQRSLSTTRKYPVVISFSDDDDALDEEARVMDVPRPPLPSVNRMHGRIGFDYLGTHSLDSSEANGRDIGIVLRADFTRIGGTYWNFVGYYRGTISSTSAASQPTLQDVISRTYHLGLTYDNPTGHWVAGLGRLYLPWATSLNTIDGGYFGRRIHSGVITGVFAGSTPDPTSWNYNPNRQIGGSFVNFSGGGFDGLHYSSTTGAGISFLNWVVDRPFLFFENSVSYKRNFSVYSAVQADRPAGNTAVAAPGSGIGSSFLTIRWSPVQRLHLDLNHTYFRDIPTFDPALVGTGLLDKYLFQGFSGGVRVDIVKQIAVYAELGRSNRTGDSSAALNEMYGITFGRVPWLDLRADAHYSWFNSSFGSGSYRAASLSRSISERLRLELLAGDQAFASALAGNQNAKFITVNAENDLGSYLFTQAGFTVYRGQQQSYNQWMLMLGYRFDSKWKRK